MTVAVCRVSAGRFDRSTADAFSSGVVGPSDLVLNRFSTAAQSPFGSNNAVGSGGAGGGQNSGSVGRGSLSLALLLSPDTDSNAESEGDGTLLTLGFRASWVWGIWSKSYATLCATRLV